MHCLWEIIDNAVDEALAGHCTKVDVTLHPDGSAEVHDDGRGIPVDKEPKTGLSGVEVVFTKLHAGGSSAAARTPRPAACTASAPPWSTRSPRVSTSRSTARRPPRRCRSSEASRASSPATGPGPRSTRSRAAQGQPGQEGRHRHPGPVLARPPDLHQGREVHLGRAGHPGPADLVHRPGPPAQPHRPARRRAGHRVVPPRRRDHRVLHVPPHDEPVIRPRPGPALHAHGVHGRLERRRPHVGLPLPRVPLHGGRRGHRGRAAASSPP